MSARNGLVVDATTSGLAVGATLRDGVLENLAVINPSIDNPSCGTSCGVVASRGTHLPGARLENITIAWQPGVTVSNLSAALDAAPGSPYNVTIDGLLIAHLQGPSAQDAITGSAAALAGITWQNLCFFDNVGDFDPAYAAYFTEGNPQFGDPGLTNPLAMRFDPVAGGLAHLSDCGIRRGIDAPGIKRFVWFHALSRLAPEMMTDDVDEDGIPEDAAAVVCSDGALEDCSDNCEGVFNPDQRDADGDAIGDACDPACSDGVDNDADGFTDYPADPGCADANDDSERNPSLPCDDGIDNEDPPDGFADYRADGSGDPGCRDPSWTTEEPKCQDGIDNDGKIGTDFDGGESVLGAGDGDPDGPDPQCSASWRNRERASSYYCGLGMELVLLAPLLWLHLRRRRARI